MTDSRSLTEQRRRHLCSLVSRFAIRAVIGIGTLVLLGWIFDIPTLKSVLPGMVTMRFNAAICFILIGFSFLLLQRMRQLAVGIALFVAALAGLTLSQDVMGWNLGIDNIFFAPPQALQDVHPGRMAPIAAIDFVLAGIALISFNAKPWKNLLPRELIAAALGAVALPALFGYATGLVSMYRVGSPVAVAVHTLVAFVLLGLAIMFARPESGFMAIATSDGGAGVMVRGLIPATLVIPPVLGFVVNRGEAAGFYTGTIGVGLLAASTTLAGLIVISWVGVLLSHGDAERRKAVLDLENSERGHRLVVDTAFDSFVAIDQEGLITNWNTQAERTFGWTRGEVIGHDLMETIVPPQHRQAHSQGIEHFLATGEGPILSKRIEFTAIHRDGHEIPVELAVWYVLDGDKYVFNAFISDISDRKLAERQLEQSNQLLRSVVEASPLPIISVSRERQVLSWNTAAERVFGWSADEVVGQPFPLIPAGQEDEQGKLSERIFEGEVVTELDVVRKRKDGSPISVNLSAAPVADAQGRFSIAVGVYTDIGERKLLEAQLRQAQKMEAIGRLAGGVAHDFNNLLTVILGYAELIRAQIAPGDALLLRVQGIHDAAERAASLTRQLLAFSRKQVLVPQVLNLNVVLARAEKMLRRVIGEDIDMRVVPAQDLGRIKADPGQIEQVIMNLVVNSRDAMPGGGSLTLETANVELDESYAAQHSDVKPGRYTKLTITDTGVGMDAHTVSRIFEPFFTTKEAGTGLGLATVHGIVRQSGGSIEVYSEPSHGTTFKVYLPRVDEPAAATGNVKSSRSLKGAEVVLLAEDDEAVRTVTSEVLRSAGYTVLESRNGSEALSVSAHHEGPLHLLITDMVMPRSSGTELAKAMSNLRPGIKVLFVSGYSEEAIVHQGDLLPTARFLQKPFVPDRLLEMVRELLEGHLS